MIPAASDQIAMPSDIPQIFRRLKDDLGRISAPHIPLLDSVRDDIRLAKILPGQNGSQIRYQLSVHSWAEMRPYLAVSYVENRDAAVGERKPIRQKGISSRTKMVTENLHHCLELIRSACDQQHGITVWIDALCVDFENIAERNEHARYRRRIFENATECVIWVGAADLDTPSAIRDLRILADRPETEPWFEIDEATWNSYNISGIVKLLANSWFFDVWARQDSASMSLNNSFIMWGQNHFPLSCLEQFIRHLNRYWYVIRLWPAAKRENIERRWSNLSSDLGFVSWIEWTFHYDDERARVHSLRDVIYIASRLQANDKRDHIYGALGMFQGNVQGRWDSLVDYQQELWLAFARVVEVESKHAGRLMTFELSKTGHPAAPGSEEHSFPSWVPDFSEPLEQGEDTFRLYESIYSAGCHEGANAGMTFDFGQRTVSLRGLTIGSIQKMAWKPNWMQSLKARDSLRLFIENCEALIEASPSVQDRYGKTRGLIGVENALWRTLVADAAMIPNSMYGAVYERWPKAERGRSFRVSAGQLSDTMFTPREYEFPRRPGEEPLDVSPAHFDATVRQLSYSHFVVTSQGYVALAPYVAKENDLVCVFTGSLTPHVIRKHPTKETFVLIGEAYVHGLMDGEAFAEQLPQSVFTLS